MKKILNLIMFLSVFAIYGQGQPHSGGIVVPTGFNIQASTPIDDRFVVADSLSLYDLSNKYDGMFAVTLDEEKRVLWTYNEGEGLWYRAGATDAENISYNNTSSQLEADNVQDVIDEIDTKAIYKSDDSDEAIKYISIKDTIGENLETIYFVPKLHITIKQGQL